MSILRDIANSYLSPGTVAARRLRTTTEVQALVILMAACGMIFVSQWPSAARLAHLDPAVTLNQRIGAALWAWVFMAPLLFYGLAGMIWLVLRLARVTATGLSVRIAVFWTLLAAAPAWLVYGLARGLGGTGPPETVAGAALTIAFVYILFGSLRAVLSGASA